MTEQRERELIRRAINQRFSDRQENPWLAERIIKTERGEIKMKKKLSVGLVFILALSLAAVTGLAAALGGYFDSFAKLENTYGEYEQWPDSAKVELVTLMIDGSMFSAEEAKTWKDLPSGQEKENATDSLLENYFKGMVYVDTYNVMERELGAIDSWTLEEKALYTSLLEKYGKQKEDWPRYTIPTSGDMNRQDIVSRAKDALTSKFEVTDEMLDSKVLETNFFSTQIYGDFGPDPIWEVAFRDPGMPGMAYVAVMTRSGEMLLIESPASMYISWNEDIMEKAKIIEPQTHDAAEETAIEKAINALTEIKGLSIEEAESMSVKTYFFIHERYSLGLEPVWMVTFADQHGQGAYKVLLGYDASYIDVVRAEKEFSNVSRRFVSIDEQYYPNGIINEQGKRFDEWSNEDKAAFSQDWNTVVEDYSKANPYYKNYERDMYKATRHTYGIPDDKAISIHEAIDIGRRAIVAAGADEATVHEREVKGFYFDITTADKPVWKLDFGISISEVGDYWVWPFRAIIDAKTSEVIEAFRVEKPSYPLY